MTILLFLVAGGLLLLLLFISSVRPMHASESLFELRRRQKMRDRRAEDALQREALLAQGAVLSSPLKAILLILITAVLVYLLGWTVGLLSSLIIGILYAQVAGFTMVRKFANKVYKRREETLLGFISKYEKAIQIIGGKEILKENTIPLGSKEELTHLLDLSPLFSSQDKQLLERTFGFKERTVKELMTPRSKVVTVADTELLGPLVLHDLHKTGYTIFPVVKGEEVVGLLDSTDHFDLHTKESVHVRSVMHTDVARVSQGARLNEALRALLATKEQLLIVMGDDEDMTGIVSLKDIVRAIVGRE